MSSGISGITVDEITAEETSFDKTGIKFNSTNVQDAVEEVRSNSVLSITNLTSSLNGNHDIEHDHSAIHVVEGTATGYSVTLPDATTLFDGRRFEVINNSSENVLLKDNGGNVLATLIQDDAITATLESNATVNGSWLTTVVTSASTGITSYVVTSDTLFSTSSPTDVIITGFTVTPVIGRYSLFYSADIEISSNNKLADCVAFVGGSAIGNTRKQVQGVGSGFISAQQTIGEITVNGSQAVDIRVKISSGSLDVNQRSLVLIRLGS